ncbi:heterokaryon incompatibility protein-domain-containing protein [Penicillium malachiteum]|nr:heterokaryon incompatibility protein-domain-containing protein [Penicillium malachiteum]
MWLINTRTIKLKYFVTPQHAPSYAILSHTWGYYEDEISFQEMRESDLRSSKHSKRPGWQKIKQACAKAFEDYNYRYIWIDTCCIDKTSSTELQEAINSMFSYYAESAICFAYLSDVEVSRFSLALDKKFELFQRARWFTRGWTLQELLAPKKLEFFNKSWHSVGSRRELCDLISDITGIRDIYLHGADNIARQPEPASVAERMSWAAKRETTRLEDKAYCLLGLFDVHMPLLYGEGDRAFLRLQEEILRSNDDVTIHLWSMPNPSGHARLNLRLKNTYIRSLREHPLMAPGPQFFSNSLFATRETPLKSHFEPNHALFKPPSFVMGQRGLTVHMPLRRDPRYKCLTWGIIFDARHSTDFMAIPLISVATSSQSRQTGVKEYWRPIWCRPVFVPLSFVTSASSHEVLIRRRQDYEESFYNLPFRLRMHFSDKLTFIGAYPPSPLSARGELISLFESPYPDFSEQDVENSGKIYIGGRRFYIHIKTESNRPEFQLLLVLNYCLGPTYGDIVPFERHERLATCISKLNSRVFLSKGITMKGTLTLETENDQHDDKVELPFISDKEHRYYPLTDPHEFENLLEDPEKSFVSSDTFLDVRIMQEKGEALPIIDVALRTGKVMTLGKKEVTSNFKAREWQFGWGTSVVSEPKFPWIEELVEVRSEIARPRGSIFGASKDFEEEALEPDGSLCYM